MSTAGGISTEGSGCNAFQENHFIMYWVKHLGLYSLRIILHGSELCIVVSSDATQIILVVKHWFSSNVKLAVLPCSCSIKTFTWWGHREYLGKMIMLLLDLANIWHMFWILFRSRQVFLLILHCTNRLTKVSMWRSQLGWATWKYGSEDVEQIPLF